MGGAIASNVDAVLLEVAAIAQTSINQQLQVYVGAVENPLQLRLC